MKRDIPQHKRVTVAKEKKTALNQRNTSQLPKQWHHLQTVDPQLFRLRGTKKKKNPEKLCRYTSIWTSDSENIVVLLGSYFSLQIWTWGWRTAIWYCFPKLKLKAADVSGVIMWLPQKKKRRGSERILVLSSTSWHQYSAALHSCKQGALFNIRTK